MIKKLVKGIVAYWHSPWIPLPGPIKARLNIGKRGPSVTFRKDESE